MDRQFALGMIAVLRDARAIYTPTSTAKPAKVLDRQIKLYQDWLSRQSSDGVQVLVVRDPDLLEMP